MSIFTSVLRIVVSGIVALGLFSNVAVFAGDNHEKHEKSVTYQMAEIMHRLKHYPSPEGKDVLKKIIRTESTTETKRTIATAMLNLQHKVAPNDVSKLETIIADKSVTAHERELATIVLKLDHRPSSEDKAKLKAMMN